MDILYLRNKLMPYAPEWISALANLREQHTEWQIGELLYAANIVYVGDGACLYVGGVQVTPSLLFSLADIHVQWPGMLMEALVRRQAAFVHMAANNAFLGTMVGAVHQRDSVTVRCNERREPVEIGVYGYSAETAAHLTQMTQDAADYGYCEEFRRRQRRYLPIDSHMIPVEAGQADESYLARRPPTPSEREFLIEWEIDLSRINDFPANIDPLNGLSLRSLLELEDKEDPMPFYPEAPEKEKEVYVPPPRLIRIRR